MRGRARDDDDGSRIFLATRLMRQVTKLSCRTGLWIFLAALAVRAAYVLAQYHFNLFGGAFVGADSTFYLETARNILSGNGFADGSAPTAYVTPGFPIFLAGLLAVFGENLLWTSLFQCLLSAAVCVFIAQTAALLFGKRAGICAGLMAAFYYELVLWTSGQILTEPLYTFLIAASVFALVSATVAAAAAADGAKKTVTWRFALAGLLFGLAALVRPVAFPAVLGLGFLLILSGFLEQGKKLRQGLIFTAAFLFALQPWALRNYLVFDHYLLTSYQGGHVFWLGNNPEYDRYEHIDFERFGGYTVMFQPSRQLGEQLAGKPTREKDRIYAAEARKHIIEHPAAFAARALHKTWNMWRPTFSGSSLANKIISHTFYPLLLALAVIGIFLARRQQQQQLSETEKIAANGFWQRLTAPAGLLCVFFC